MSSREPVHGFLSSVSISKSHLKVCFKSNKSPKGLVGKTLLVTDFGPCGSRPFLHIGQGIGDFPIIIVVEDLVNKKVKADRVQPGLGCLCLSVILIRTSDVYLSDP